LNGKRLEMVCPAAAAKRKKTNGYVTLLCFEVALAKIDDDQSARRNHRAIAIGVSAHRAVRYNTLVISTP